MNISDPNSVWRFDEHELHIKSTALSFPRKAQHSDQIVYIVIVRGKAFHWWGGTVLVRPTLPRSAIIL